MNNSQNTKEIKCYIIKYESYDFYNAESKEDAIKMFKEEHSNDDEIIEVSE